MFTPPPSPLPVPRIIVTDESESGSGSDSDSSSRLRIEEEGNREKKDKNSSELDSPSSFYIIPSSQSGEKIGLSRKEQQQRTKMKVQVTPTQAQTAAAAEAIIRDYEQKKRTARRTRWAVLLVPAVLVLVAFTSRRVLRPFDALDELEEALGRSIDVSSNVDVVDVQDDASLLVPSRSEVRTDSVVVSLQGDSERHEQTTYRVHHVQNHRRQTLSLTNPAAPSSSILITPDASHSAVNSDSGSVSPTGTDSSSSPTTTVPQTEQTIPSVPDASNPPVLPTPFPQPFDTTGATGNVTTQTCANFFTNMTQTLPFRSCRPFSLLEQFSSEFIEAQTNLTLLNTLIFGTCTTSTPLDTCTANMAWFASSLASSCATELSQNNLLVAQTQLGLQAYALLRQAACLVNQQADIYCYASAAHASSPADLYLYQLPLGIGFPVTTTQPSCSTCAKSVLALYADALRGGNSSARGLEGTYEPAASQAESVCGTGFASVGVATKGSSGARRSWGSLGESWGALVMSACCVLASSVLVWS